MGVGGAAWQLGVWRDRSAPPQPAAPLVVRLLPAEPVQRPAVRVAVRAAATTPIAQIHRPAAARAPQAITLPPEPAAAPASAPTTAVPPEPPGAPAPLNLALPNAASAPGWRRHPGLDDPRANTARATLESRIAGATHGDERWLEERLDDDRMRFRRGSTCIEVHRTRDAQLDPFNQSVRPTPRMGRPC